MRYLYLRRRGQLPWGYVVSQDDPQLCEPVPEQLELLKQALIYLKGCSLREVATWLSLKSGRPITFVGLAKIAKKDFDRQYPSTTSEDTAHRWTPAPFEKLNPGGRPKGSRTAPEKLAEIRRIRKAIRKAKAKAPRIKKKPVGRPRTKSRLKPRISKPTLRECRLSTQANNIQTERGTSDNILVSE